jgi:Uma2 family endonuclease
MEVMTTSSRHDNRKSLLARLIETLTLEMDIDIASYGSMTHRREHLERALEGDECYWIAHESVVRGRLDLDPEAEPPPDLFVEIEISRSLLDRMGILAAMGVPEVWRFDGEHFRVCVLREGFYQESDRSLAFPFLPLQDFAQWLQPTGQSETQLIKSFRLWVREQMARGWK